MAYMSIYFIVIDRPSVPILRGQRAFLLTFS